MRPLNHLVINMHGDFAFTIGASHEICQDYAITNDQVAVLCDGCTSSKHTDVGARLLAHSMYYHMNGPSKKLYLLDDQQDALSLLYSNSITTAYAMLPTFGLDETCLDATALAIQVHGDEYTASAYGDGAIVAGRQDGSFEVTSIRFTNSYPQYPNYLTSKRRLALFQAEVEAGNDKIATCYNIENGIVKHLTETQLENAPIIHQTGNIKDYKFVAITSDGASSFMHKDTRASIPESTILASLMNFKSLNGQFVARKLSAFMKRDVVSNNWTNFDDVSVAAICFGEN